MCVDNCIKNRDDVLKMEASDKNRSKCDKNRSKCDKNSANEVFSMPLNSAMKLGFLKGNGDRELGFLGFP